MKVRITLNNDNQNRTVLVDVNLDPNYAKILTFESIDDDGNVIGTEMASVNWRGEFGLSKTSYADPIWLARKQKEYANHP